MLSAATDLPQHYSWILYQFVAQSYLYFFDLYIKFFVFIETKFQ
ncbi:unnamed protein product [Larinioides sclopetarius]|uniref:Uncharacterized protein n=1 Tax=Larinioides sclopetarius TaxID=280406 RepID=A0AAV2BDE6_9ARAC